MRRKVDHKAYHLFCHYRRVYGSKYGGVQMTQTLHTGILMSFFDKLIHSMIYENVDFTFPYRLGNLSIKKKKQVIRLTPEGKLDTSKLRVDMKATYELRKENPGTDKKIYHLNEHTDGYYYRYLWSKLTCLVPNSTVYLLDLRRKHKRALAAAANDPKTKLNFYEMAPYKPYINANKTTNG